jgi:hypothetical protein
VVHGFGDGGGNPGEPDLSDPARAQFINLFIWIVEAPMFQRARLKVTRRLGSL